MANKIKLGARPQTFKPFHVKFETPDGTAVAIACTFKYRSKKEHGEWLDQTFFTAGVEAQDEEAFSMERLMAKGIDKAAAALLDVLAAWDVPDQPLTLVTLQQLGDECPAATGAMLEAYRAACVEGRLGN